MLLGCNGGHGSRGNLTGTRAQTGRIIVLVDERFKDQSFARLESHLKGGAGHAKQIICTRITTSQNKEEHLRELTSIHNRAVILNEYILQAIERNGWDKKQDEFVLLGYSEQGIAALEAAETLRHTINLTKVAVISAPLCGYDFFNADYGLDYGAIGQLIMGMSQATLGRNSTVLEELTPGSKYLSQRHAFIESQTESRDLKIYIAASSIYNLCYPSASISYDLSKMKMEQDVTKLFNEVAKRIRTKYHTARNTRNAADLPGEEEYGYLLDFLGTTNREGFYTYYKLLNGNKDHNGKISVETQMASHITNPRVKRGVFNSYSGTLFIPYKSLKNVKSLGLFHEQEYTINDSRLYDALLNFILDR
ncbi:MAG: hypothetical protein ACYC2U_04045 [Candidatus Amoebophilus sp.]